MSERIAERMRVRGTVQGVGFRPTVWRIARELGVAGSVINDAEGVLIVAVGTSAQLDALAARVQAEPPPLARIAVFEREPVPCPGWLDPEGFAIGASRMGEPMTAVAADAALCAACAAEILDPFARRFRYPLTNCTHCGPRLSFTTGVPYDRSRTTMAGFPMCADCRAEYESPADRRFHAEAIACHVCGPAVTLSRYDGRAFAQDRYTFLDACDAAGTLLAQGHIVAIKGLGGWQLACDATNAVAVQRLRALKQREAKPFALMAATVEAVRECCRVSEAEAALLRAPSAPIVLLARRAAASPGPAIAEAVAPGVNTLGFMLPNTGVHLLVMRRMRRPIVLSSGNRSDEPQAITLEELKARFGPAGDIDYVLDHTRPIARRVDDSVVRMVEGEPRVLRRARGYAPRPIALPAGFERMPPVLAYGGELKNTVCLARDGQALLSQHLGDLEDAATLADWQRALADLQRFHGFVPALRACDAHPDYLSTQRAHADGEGIEVLHHHAHLAACLAENGWPLDGGPVLGVALDGLGYGEGGALWGGEFAVTDYRRFERVGTFKPVALLGGARAMREPWRNTYAHLMAEMGWPAFAMNHGELELFRFLDAKPRETLDAMQSKGLNAPLASSCGRLFDAVAAAVGLARDHAAYEGQGAVLLEAQVDEAALANDDDPLAYPFAIPRLKDSGLPYIEPLAMWHALLGDLILKTPVPVIAARFHRGLTKAILTMVDQLAGQDEAAPLRTVALSGGVFQNRLLFQGVSRGLSERGYTVLSHREVPCNDGGLSLGQAVVAAARHL